MTDNMFDPQYWDDAWHEVRKTSILQKTQNDDPDRWERFYDNVSSIWQEMVGDKWVLSQKVVDLFIREGLVSMNSTAIDVGCGPGMLAMSLALKGVRTTAIDSSIGMIDCLKSEISKHGIQGVTPKLVDWDQYQPDFLHNLAVAGFFPQAMTPSGLCRLESWSRSHCALIIGTGKEVFSFKSRLWKKLMDKPLPHGGRHLTCAFNYLMACGRSPNLIHLSWPVEIDLPLETVANYYRNYFQIFGKSTQEVEEAMKTELSEYLKNGFYLLSGHMDVAVIWWSSQNAS